MSPPKLLATGFPAMLEGMAGGEEDGGECSCSGADDSTSAAVQDVGIPPNPAPSPQPWTEDYAEDAAEEDGRSQNWAEDVVTDLPPSGDGEIDAAKFFGSSPTPQRQPAAPANANPNDALYAAVAKRDKKLLMMAIGSGADPNYAGGEGSPLAFAAYVGNAEICMLLMGAGAVMLPEHECVEAALAAGHTELAEMLRPHVQGGKFARPISGEKSIDVASFLPSASLDVAAFLPPPLEPLTPQPPPLPQPPPPMRDPTPVAQAAEEPQPIWHSVSQPRELTYCSEPRESHSRSTAALNTLPLVREEWDSTTVLPYVSPSKVHVHRQPGSTGERRVSFLESSGPKRDPPPKAGFGLEHTRQLRLRKPRLLRDAPPGHGPPVEGAYSTSHDHWTTPAEAAMAVSDAKVAAHATAAAAAELEATADAAARDAPWADLPRGKGLMQPRRPAYGDKPVAAMPPPWKAPTVGSCSYLLEHQESPLQRIDRIATGTAASRRQEKAALAEVRARAKAAEERRQAKQLAEDEKERAQDFVQWVTGNETRAKANARRRKVLDEAKADRHRAKLERTVAKHEADRKVEQWRKDVKEQSRTQVARELSKGISSTARTSEERRLLKERRVLITDRAARQHGIELPKVGRPEAQEAERARRVADLAKLSDAGHGGRGRLRLLDGQGDPGHGHVPSVIGMDSSRGNPPSLSGLQPPSAFGSRGHAPSIVGSDSGDKEPKLVRSVSMPAAVHASEAAWRWRHFRS